jgi:hypothetical protein
MSQEYRRVQVFFYFHIWYVVKSGSIILLMGATAQNCKKKPLTLPDMARSNFKPRCFKQLKIGTVAHSQN